MTSLPKCEFHRYFKPRLRYVREEKPMSVICREDLIPAYQQSEDIATRIIPLKSEGSLASKIHPERYKLAQEAERLAEQAYVKWQGEPSPANKEVLDRCRAFFRETMFNSK